MGPFFSQLILNKVKNPSKNSKFKPKLWYVFQKSFKISLSRSFEIKICFYISAKLCIRSFCCYNLLLVFLHYIYVYEFMLFKIILDKKEKKICQKASVGQPFSFVVSSIMKQISEISMYLDLISFTKFFSLYCIDKSGFYRHNDGITFLFLMFFLCHQR